MVLLPGSKLNITPGERVCKRAEGEPNLHPLLYSLNVVFFFFVGKGKKVFL